MDRYYMLSEQFLKDMVAFRTINGSEKPLAEYIEKTLHIYGFQTQVQDIGENRANVVASYGNSENCLIFTGHLDVVPPGEGWNTGDPFRLTRRGGRLYGRGTCDMKGGISAMMASAIRALETGELQNCELRLVLVADEEVNGTGTQHYVARGELKGKPIVVIGEPTMLDAAIAHRGVTRFKVHINGRQCHSGVPQQGINAIYLMARFLLAIEAFDRERQNMKCGILPPPNVTSTIVQSGVKENAVPGTCEVILDCRTVPGETVESLRNDIERILKELFAGTPVTYEVNNFIHVPPSETRASGRACTVMKEAFRNVFGKTMTVTYFNGCCDMPYFCQAGFVETLICGPGSMDQAHVVNEYIEIEQLHRAVDLYTEVIRQVQKG